MIINGVINNNLATMSFNEHYYVIKRVSMSFPTLYYLGLNPLFGDYVEESNSLVVAGKLSKRDILKKEEIIFGDVTITKDDEDISIDEIDDNTNYLKNIDVNTGECLSRIYIKGDVNRLDRGFYSYKNNDSLVLVTTNLDKKDFNIFDLKDRLSTLFSILGYNSVKEGFNVTSVKKMNNGDNFYEMIINFNDIDFIKAFFRIDDNNFIKFYPYIYSSNFDYKCILDNSAKYISASSFPYYLAMNNFIKSINNAYDDSEREKVKKKIYIGDLNKQFFSSCSIEH